MINICCPYTLIPPVFVICLRFYPKFVCARDLRQKARFPKVILTARLDRTSHCRHSFRMVSPVKKTWHSYSPFPTICNCESQGNYLYFHREAQTADRSPFQTVFLGAALRGTQKHTQKSRL